MQVYYASHSSHRMSQEMWWHKSRTSFSGLKWDVTLYMNCDITTVIECFLSLCPVLFFHFCMDFFLMVRLNLKTVPFYNPGPVTLLSIYASKITHVSTILKVILAWDFSSLKPHSTIPYSFDFDWQTRVTITVFVMWYGRGFYVWFFEAVDICFQILWRMHSLV